jgi:Ca2+-dependent lipid-binding protein
MPLRLFLVIFAISFFLYSRPGVALYDIRTIISASPQGKTIDTQITRFAEKRHLSKDLVVEKFNEHWQHDVTFFQLGDVFCFALFLAILIRRRYLVEHLIFSLHAISFTVLYGCVSWLYYAHYGFKQNWTLVFVSSVIFFVYLWKAVPQVYGDAGWKAAAKALCLTVGLELSRIFFMTFTVFLATIQTFR